MPDSYYYDAETGFYYLQSRYYDPTLGRFINADSYASTGQGYLGYNMFAYCGNKPVFSEDPSGTKIEIVDDYYSGIIGKLFKFLSRVVIFACLDAITDDTLIISGNSIDIKQKNENPTHPVGTNLVREVIESEQTVSINTFIGALPWGSVTVPSEYNYGTMPQDCSIHFDYTQSNTLGSQRNPAYIIMAHELIHAYHIMNGTHNWSFSENQVIGLDVYSSEIYSENSIRTERGLITRDSYEIGGIR